MKHQTLNPYYNESFQFQVPQELIQRVYVVVSIWDYDRLSRNDLIGRCVLGALESKAPDLSALGNRHWMEMLQGRRPVAHWHTLQAKADE